MIVASRREPALFSKWLEVPDGALLLEAARTYRPPRRQRRPLPFGHELVATFLLTGGRESEVLGLEVWPTSRSIAV